MTVLARETQTPWAATFPRDATVVLAMILGFSILRLASAALVGLGVDEAYTLAIARRLQLSSFDHPPLHLWLVHLCAGLSGYGRLARIPFIAVFAGSSWLLFELTRRLFGSKAGVWAVLALNLSAFFSVVASSWVLPDGPLMFCLLAAACGLAPLVVEGRGLAPSPREAWHAWIGAGLWLGLAGLCKYQAVIFAFGGLLFLASTPVGRAWLRRPQPYVAAGLALAVFSPVLIWNAQHHWVSFAFQGARAAPAHGLLPAAVLSALLGQAALLLPWIFVPLTVAGWRGLRSGPADAPRWLCVTLGAPLVVLFLVTPVWGQTGLPHWAMPGWLMLMPLLGDSLARSARESAWPRLWASVSLTLLLLLWALLVSDAATGWVGQAWPRLLAKGDPTLEAVEWTGLAEDPANQSWLARPGVFVVSMKWNEAGRLRPLFGDKTQIRVFSDDPRGFAFDDPPASRVGHDALIVVKPEDLGAGLDRIRLCFEKVEPLRISALGRAGHSELQLHLFAASRLRPDCSALGGLDDSAHTQWRRLKGLTAPRTTGPLTKPAAAQSTPAT